VGEEANLSEAQCHPGLRIVYAAGRWGEGQTSYPGRSALQSGVQKSATVIVAACARRRRTKQEEPNRLKAFDVRSRRRPAG